MGRRSHGLTTDDCKAISVAEKPTATIGSKNGTALTPSRGQTPIAPEVMKRLSGCENFLKLSLKHQKFVLEFLKEYNITRAYQNVYHCNAASAAANGARLIANDKVQFALSEVSRIMTKEDIASAQEVKEFLTKIMRGRVTDVLSWTTDGLLFTKSSEEMDPEQAKLIKRIKVTEKTSQKGDWTVVRTEVELHDALKAAELIGQTHGIFKSPPGGAVPIRTETYEEIRIRLGIKD
jgi:phage terminase small subunit